MRRWLLLLGVVAVVAACGDDDAGLDAEAPATSSTGPRPESTSPADGLEVGFPGDDEVPAGPHTWTLELTNTSGAAVVVTFPTSQRGDVVLVRDGEIVHRWSDDRFFQQRIDEVSIAAGATEVFELDDDLSAVDPGTYEATATLEVVDTAGSVSRDVRVVSPGG